MKMREIQICLVLSMALFVMSENKDETIPKNLRKREALSTKDRKDYHTLQPVISKRFSAPEIPMISPPPLINYKNYEQRRRMSNNFPPQGSMQGYLQLVPITPNNDVRNPKRIRTNPFPPAQERIMSGYSTLPDYLKPQPPKIVKSKPAEEMNFGEKLARWFFSADDDSSEEASSEISRSVSRPPPNYRYEKFPPYWGDESNGGVGPKFQGPSGPKPLGPKPPGPKPSPYQNQEGSAKSHRYLRPKGPPPPPPRSNYNNRYHNNKKECDPCNTVPWVPIWKNSIAPSTQTPVNSYGVPVVDVHHDSTGYSSSNQASVVPAGPAPAPVVEHSSDTTFSNSYGLPVGNIPTGHGLLAPVNHLASVPSNYNPPNYVQPISMQGIPFPELSSVQLAPIHNSQSFGRPETSDLVPPVPPKSSNVVFTISEQNDPNNHDPNDNHEVHDNHVGKDEIDQSSEPSSLIDSHASPQEYHRFQAQRNHNNHNHHNNGGSLDIVKSVPLAEYTSSIEYPLHVIQSGPYIDITTSANATTKSPTYEKESQTGDKKISDIILGSDNKKAGDNVAAGSGVTEVADSTLSFSETSTPSPTNYDKGSSPFFIEVRPSDPSLQQEFISPDQGLPFYAKDWLDPNILTPPPVPPSLTQLLPLPGVASFNLPGGTPTPYLNPPRPTKEAPTGLLAPSSTTWLLPAQSGLYPQWLLPASSSPEVPYPFLENQGIASVINGGLLPPPPAQPLNPKSPKTKKIQIIIPYTTVNDQEKPSEPLPEAESANTWQPMSSTEPTPQGRKIPGPYQNFDNFKNKNFAEGQQSETKSVKHILATNIKELLTDEVEKPKSEQNIRLQKNIDDWTALEYSNHKISTKKEPQDVISHAQAVTSIPGTSISHLLLPSKKIPTNYLTTTPIPQYDEATTTPFATSSVSVESKPFTESQQPLMTASMYSTVSRNGQFTTTPKPETKSPEEKRKIFKININRLEQMKQQNIRNSQLTNFAIQENHRNGYKDVTPKASSQWSKLNENLIVPEDVSGKTLLSKFETTTSGPYWSDSKVSISTNNEKVYVVTPVSLFDNYKRTTRHVSTTEKLKNNSTITTTTTKAPATTTTTTEKPRKIFSYTKTIKETRQNAKIHQNFTRLEKVTNATANSTQLFTLRNETTPRPKPSKYSRPKPLDRYFQTTTLKVKTTTTTTTTTTKRPTTKPEDDKPSLNDIFPFRNGGELPLEMSSQTSLNSDEIRFKNVRERKTLIKQVKINSKKVKDGKKSGKDSTEETTTTTTETSTTPTPNLDFTKLEVDVLLPYNDTAKAKTSKPEEKTEKTPFIKFRTQSTHIQRVTKRLSKEAKPTPDYRQLKSAISKFNPDEPNITEDEREKINDLPSFNEKETLLAVETKLPKGVFGETTKVGSNQNATHYSSIFGPEKIQETIRLLKEFLSDTSEESSSEKTETNNNTNNNTNINNNSFKINKNFTEYEKLLDRLENLKPMMSNMTSEIKPMETKMNVTQNLKNLENKLLKKFNGKEKVSVDNSLLKSSDDLSLNKHEFDLVEGAMVELKKNQKQKNLET